MEYPTQTADLPSVQARKIQEIYNKHYARANREAMAEVMEYISEQATESTKQRDREATFCAANTNWEGITFKHCVNVQSLKKEEGVSQKVSDLRDEVQKTLDRELGEVITANSKKNKSKIIGVCEYVNRNGEGCCLNAKEYAEAGKWKGKPMCSKHIGNTRKRCTAKGCNKLAHLCKEHNNTDKSKNSKNTELVNIVQDEALTSQMMSEQEQQLISAFQGLGINKNIVEKVEEHVVVEKVEEHVVVEKVEEKVVEQAVEQTVEQVEEQMDEQAVEQVEEQMDEQAVEQVEEQMDEQVVEQVVEKVEEQVENVKELNNNNVVECEDSVSFEELSEEDEYDDYVNGVGRYDDDDDDDEYGDMPSCINWGSRDECNNNNDDDDLI